jgi:hypothetical protein
MAAGRPDGCELKAACVRACVPGEDVLGANSLSLNFAEEIEEKAKAEATIDVRSSVIARPRVERRRIFRAIP